MSDKRPKREIEVKTSRRRSKITSRKFVTSAATG